MNDEMLQDYGAAVLVDDPRPELQMLESLEHGEVREEGGHWYRGWVVVPADPEALAEAITSTFEHSIQGFLNASAVAHGYDDIMTAVSYAEEPAVPKFQNDGKAFRAWRSLVWAYAYEQLAAVKDGTRRQPTIEEFLGELPALVLTK
ncbi:hypothetical protein [Pseudomonas petrae]|uniref:Uncharacterized protein n=1 Tax=Pseudomonas petrae TaxID=2912190 RepID=A0ABS9I813_9PSED|nr:hypothetical protein [Pseudomonas petrae]MCF7543892.1 hypothetical protein [Pseudomonas petrae]